MKSGTPGFVPGRLAEARAARRIPTKSALARLLGISPSTVSRWEDGSSSPDTEGLMQLSRKLDLRPAFFLRPILESDKPAFLRSLSSTLVRDRDYQLAQMRWLQEISAAIEHYVDFPDLDIPDVLGRTSYRQLRDEDLELIAGGLRQHWGLGDGPCLDVVALLERIGIIVGSIEIGTAKLDGICSWSPESGRPHVLLAEDKMSFARRQMDAAHELAHAVLHREVTRDELKRDLKFIEAQAFRLASALLMPSTSYPLEVSEVSLSTFVVLKERWKTSVKSQIKRLSDLDIISKEYSVHLYKLYSAKGWSRGEPYDDVWSLQEPRALRDAITLIVDENVRTKEDLLNLEFTMTAEDVESLSNLPHGWLSRSSAEIVKLKEQNRSKLEPLLDTGNRVIPFPKT